MLRLRGCRENDDEGPMTSKLHNLLLWLITAILLAVAGPALAATDARLQGAAEQVYGAVIHGDDAVDSVRHGLRRGAEDAIDGLYDFVTHLAAGSRRLVPNRGG